MFMFITKFQKVVAVSIWTFNNILLHKRSGMLPCRNTNYLTMNKIRSIFLNKLIMENYGYT